MKKITMSVGRLLTALLAALIVSLAYAQSGVPNSTKNGVDNTTAVLQQNNNDNKTPLGIPDPKTNDDAIQTKPAPNIGTPPPVEGLPDDFPGFP